VIKIEMSTLDIIKTRRSVRKFTCKPVSDEDAIKILNAARIAPSGGNRQRWKFIYVKDPQALRMVKNCSPGFYGDAAAAIVAGIESEKGAFGGASYGSTVGTLDIGFAAENILLAAHALGLGGCAIASFNASSLSKVINAPENFRPVLIVSIGYPDGTPNMPKKKSLSEIVYLNEYGVKWGKLEGL
jgi:nitroreductase